MKINPVLIIAVIVAAAFVVFSVVVKLTASSSPAVNEELPTVTVDVGTGTAVTEVTTVVTEPEIIPVDHSDSDRKIADWFSGYMNSTADSEDESYFSDVLEYQYYARTLGLDKDYFLDPELWEVYYSEDINLNRDITHRDIYLIRLNPDKLLEIYATRCEMTVDELCRVLSVSQVQLYYNWGYDPCSVDYGKAHENGNTTYSELEEQIFGAYNGESRDVIMCTHVLTYDRDNDIVTYSSYVDSTLRIKRRDILNTKTDSCFYSDYTEGEKEPSFKENGIGIRAVIPLNIPNAAMGRINFEREENAVYEQDRGITPMINVSPYAYGCRTTDKVELAELLSSGDEE